MLFKDILRREFTKKESDVVVSGFSGVAEVGNPMGAEEVVIRERGVLISPKLIIDFFPRIVYILA